jgi:hypothetical protein
MVPDVKRDNGEDEVWLAVVAQQVWDGSRGPGDFMDTFAGAMVYVQRPEQPALLVTDLGERGRWMVVFSTLERLAAHAGECDYFATTGADLLELVPPGIGLMVDPDDEHRFPVLSRVAPPDVVARAWAQAGGRRRRERSTTV